MFMWGVLAISAILFAQGGVTAQNTKYEPTWKSLDTRPLPSWYDEAKFGIFINWGVYTVPSYHSEWFWWAWKGAKEQDVVDFMKKNYPPNFTYADFASMFKAEFFDPNEWADILAASGAKYIVLSSKHHEGFTNWPSAVSWNWNSVDVGPKRDLVGDLAKAVRNRTQLHFGLYHSLFEWFNPLYLKDKENKYKTQSFVMAKAMPELYDLVERYEPEVIWSDGDWEAPDIYWNSTKFLAWLYNESPVKDRVVVNDRWGQGITCHHGDFYTCHDKYNPGVLQKHKWENAMTVDRYSWGYRRNAKIADILTMDELVATLVETVSCGGNLLMNIGPTADGRFIPVFEERLRQMGQWLGVNGGAIYGTKPWAHQNDTVTKGVWYTSKKTATGTTVYAMALTWPSGSLTLGAVTASPGTTVSLLGLPGTLPYKARGGTPGIVVDVSSVGAGRRPGQWGWVFQLDHVTPTGHPGTEKVLKRRSLKNGNRVVVNL